MYNPVTMNLAPYPMEELAKIRNQLFAEGKKVFDFGTGDPQIPVWKPIRDAIKESIGEISQYPSIRGTPELQNSIWNYLERRHSLKNRDDFVILPTNGSKEAVFHIALSLVGRAGGRRTIAYPNPGYPVYGSGINFSGGIPYPVDLKRDNNYLLEPWNLPEAVKSDLAAVWINYPHNPTGATASEKYLNELVEWCESNDTILLSDDCYVDIYTSESQPLSPLSLGSRNVISFMSLSKRSGLTGFRSGFIAGEKSLISPLIKARSNLGVGTPAHIQAGAVVAWSDDTHVEERRLIFSERVEYAHRELNRIGLKCLKPKGGFYLWCEIPAGATDAVGFALSLAREGVICSPSNWLGENVEGYVRFALVPELSSIKEAIPLLEAYIQH